TAAKAISGLIRIQDVAWPRRIACAAAAAPKSGADSSLSQAFARGFLFENDLTGLLILTQPEEDWMAHLAGGGPLREFDLRDQLWFDPGGDGFILDGRSEGRVSRAQGRQFGMQLLEGGMREARADMADIA